MADLLARTVGKKSFSGTLKATGGLYELPESSSAGIMNRGHFFRAPEPPFGARWRLPQSSHRLDFGMLVGNIR